VVSGLKLEQAEVEPQPEKLGPHKHKATKQARGIGYNESTPSDDERRKDAAPARKCTKQERKHNPVTG
jgi:hypothetical protein